MVSFETHQVNCVRNKATGAIVEVRARARSGAGTLRDDAVWWRLKGSWVELGERGQGSVTHSGEETDGWEMG